MVLRQRKNDVCIVLWNLVSHNLKHICYLQIQLKCCLSSEKMVCLVIWLFSTAIYGCTLLSHIFKWPHCGGAISRLTVPICVTRGQNIRNLLNNYKTSIYVSETVKTEELQGNWLHQCSNGGWFNESPLSLRGNIFHYPQTIMYSSCLYSRLSQWSLPDFLPQIFITNNAAFFFIQNIEFLVTPKLTWWVIICALICQIYTTIALSTDQLPQGDSQAWEVSESSFTFISEMHLALQANTSKNVLRTWTVFIPFNS